MPALVRCILGNPFMQHTVRKRKLIPRKLTEIAYEKRKWGLLPEVARHLHRIGDEHPEVLAHLKGPGPHTRGCWVVDGILGKE